MYDVRYVKQTPDLKPIRNHRKDGNRRAFANASHSIVSYDYTNDVQTELGFDIDKELGIVAAGKFRKFSAATLFQILLYIVQLLHE